jgi:hypothetical protein
MHLDFCLLRQTNLGTECDQSVPVSFFDFAGLLLFGRWLRHRPLKPIAAQEWNAAQSMVVG